MSPDLRDLEKQYRERLDGYSEVLSRFQADLVELFNRRGLYVTIKSRVKSIESYCQKALRNLHKPKTKSNDVPVTDLLGIRVICPFLDDLRTAEQILKQNYRVLQVDYKGSNSSYREFGYESTHLQLEIPERMRTVCSYREVWTCELQLRTILQEAWAEVEHELVYKADLAPFDEPLRRKLAALNAMLTLSDIIFQEIRDFQQQLQRQLAGAERVSTCDWMT